MKPIILAYINQPEWCYGYTMTQIIKRLPEFEWVELPRTFDLRGYLNSRKPFHMLYSRANINFVDQILHSFPGVRGRTLASVTIGGKMLYNRLKQAKNVDDYLGVLAQNHETMEMWKGRRISLLPNGVDTEQFAPVSFPQEFTVGYAARTNTNRARDQKGYTEFVIPACQHEKVPLRVCDSGQKKIPHDEIHTFYNEVSVIAQPSHSEGCSNTVCEAMACGRPCLIVRGVGWHGEVCRGTEKDVDAGRANVIFVKRDVRDVCRWISRLRDDQALFDMVSKNAREFAVKHSWDAVIPKYRAAIMDGLRHAYANGRMIQCFVKKTFRANHTYYPEGSRHDFTRELIQEYPDKLQPLERDKDIRTWLKCHE